MLVNLPHKCATNTYLQQSVATARVAASLRLPYNPHLCRAQFLVITHRRAARVDSQYPGSFDLKIIGVDDDTFVSDIRKAVAGCLTNGEDNVIKCSTREKGKYTSITLKVRVENSTQLYKVSRSIV